MGNFYNPFMAQPDYGAGIAGTGQDIMQMLMMKKLMGGEQPQSQLGQTPLPQQSPMQGAAGMANTDKLMQGATDAANKFTDRDLMDILSRFMSMMKGGGMAGMGGMTGGV